jgi:V/A-type H+-transporting ATPase subunit A
MTKKWSFIPAVKAGDKVAFGDILGTVRETSIVEHRVMVPYGVEGTVEEMGPGEFTIVDTVARINTGSGIREVQMLQKWPVRRGRPYKQKLAPSSPMITGQRVINNFFPVAKGGKACIPGPFGSGKTSGAASAGKMGRCRNRCIHRLWRARK